MVKCLESLLKNKPLILFGRFQPITKAHYDLVMRIKMECTDAILSPIVYLDKDGNPLLHKASPFTPEEIDYMLNLLGVEHYILTVRPPYLINTIRGIRKVVNRYDGIAYYRVEKEKLTLKDILYSVLLVPKERDLRPKDDISASEFRKCYFNLKCGNEEWVDLVPEKIVDYLKENRDYFIERYNTLPSSLEIGDFKVPNPPGLIEKLKILYYILFP